MAWTQEMRDKSTATRERKKREAAEAKAVVKAAPPEPEPEVMPGLDEDPFGFPGLDEDPFGFGPLPADEDDPYERFLSDLDLETRKLLTEEDGSTPQLRAIFEAEVKKAKEARREVAKKQAAARASRHAKTDAGLISPEDAAAAAFQRMMNRKVKWTPRMQRDDQGRILDAGIRIDGRLLYDGIEVTGTYGEYLSCREIEWRQRQAQMDFEGKSKLNEQRRLSTGALRVEFNLNGAQA